jgi:translocation and assembly module TamB
MGGRGRTIALTVAAALGLVLLLVGAALLVLTTTDWGRERVRGLALDALSGSVEGELRIGRLEGNLLRGFRLVDVLIQDAQGRPFVAADTVATGFSLRSLLRQRIILSDLRLVRARVVLDKPPGEEWNWVRIFPRDPEAEVVEPTRPGWGDWIELHDVTLVDSRVTVRTAWEPPEDLSPAEREAALAAALSEESRANVVPVPGGYQNVADFRELHAELPWIRVSHPDSMAIPVEVARFRGIVQPFRPPAAEVRDLSGSFRIGQDTLFFRDVQAVMPGSRLAAEGAYALDAGDLVLRLSGAPVAFADLRWLYPPLPEEGGGTLQMALNLRDLSTHLVIEQMELALAGGRVSGQVDLLLGDTVRLQHTDVRVEQVDTRLLARLAPQVEVPRHGVLSGRVVLAGEAEALRVDADVAFADHAAGPNRVRAAGEVGMRGEEVRFGDFRVRVEPLQAELVRAFVPQLPLRGTVEGYAQLSGSLGGPLQLESDLVLRDPVAGASRVRAAGGVQTGGETRLRNLRVRFDPLRLDLLRDQLPQLPRGATLAGQVRLDGVVERGLQVDGTLALTDPRSGTSRVTARGGVAYADEVRFQRLDLRLDPVRLDLLREQLPQLPAGATLAGPVRLHGSPAGVLQVAGDLTLRDPRTGVSRVVAEGGVAMAGGLAFRDLRLRAEPVRLDLARPWLPALPAGATLQGVARLDGAPERLLRVESELEVRDPATGVSRVAARGGVVVGEQLRFQELALRFDPLRLEVVRAAAPDLPLGGALAGTATLNGAPEGRLNFRADLVHLQGGERSQVSGQGQVVRGGAGETAVDLRLQPLSLVTVGRFAPGAGLRGAVSGRVQARGPLSALALQSELRVAEGGTLAVQGTFDLAGEQPGYDLDVRLDDFDLAAVTARAPAATDLTGSASARGRGSDSATLRATVAADLAGSAVGDLAADEVRLRLQVEQGLLRADSSVVRLGSAYAELDGSFGLVAGREGELAYRVTVDTLAQFAAWVAPADTTAAAAAPPPTSQELALRVESMGEGEEVALRVRPEAVAWQRSGGETRVRYPGAPRPAVAGPRPPGVPGVGLAPDTTRVPGARPGAEIADVAERGVALQQPALAGSLHAEGSLRGSVARFGVQGRAAVEDFVFQGNAVERGRAEYALAAVGTPQMEVELDAEARSIRAAGLAYESATARLEFRGERYGAGRATLALRQDADTDVRLDSEFALALERNELRLGELALRFDTVTWQMAQPAALGWGGAGVEVERLDLQSTQGGRIRADGRLPLQGAGALDVELERFEIGHVAALLQHEAEATGLLSLRGRIEGTGRAPRIEGTMALEAARYQGRDLPDARARFGYAARRLRADAALLHEGRTLVVAEADLPVNLALAGEVEARLLEGPLVVDVRADDLRLDPFAGFVDAVEELRGRIVGEVAVRGSFGDPEVSGVIDLDIGSFGLAPLGVRFEEIAGTVRLRDDVLQVDSLVAWSRGPIRITGEVALASLAAPDFALEVEARDARIIDTEDARLRVDADLRVSGPLEAVRVEGEVRTRQGVIYIPEVADLGGGEVVSLEDPGTFVRVDTLLAAERAALVESSPLLAGLQLELALQVERDVWLRSTEANIEIYTPPDAGPLRIRMEGGLETLALEGTVNTDRGEYEFMGRRFRLTRGAVTFPGEPEFNPFVQLAATHEVRVPGREGFDIRVVISGTLEDLAVTLESSAQPPISQTDLMSYLAFGREANTLLQMQGSGLSGPATASGGLVGNVAGLVTQQLAAVAVEALVKDLESDAARSLGLDVVRITPAALPAELFTGSYRDVLRGTEVEMGRYLSPRLFVAGQARPTLVRPGVLVEYRTPQGYRWVSTWQPRFLPSEPTLGEQELQRASVFGSFLFREWRF